VVGIDVDVDVEMVRSTGIDCVVLVEPVPETTIVVVYVPAPSPAMFGVTVNEPGAVPEVEVSESHGAVVLALQSKVPVPESEIVTVCAAGLDPPCVAEKSRALGLRLRPEFLLKPYAWPFPFPGVAKSATPFESPSAAHPVISKQNTMSHIAIERKTNDSRVEHWIVF